MDNPTDSNDVNATSPTPVVPMAGDTAAPAPTMGGDAPAAPAEDAGTSDGTGGTTA